MKKHHKHALVLTMALALVGIGSTVAYFTNYDRITNIFDVAGAQTANTGIEIWEDFENGDGQEGYVNYDTPDNPTGKPAPATNIMPNKTIGKNVQVRSTVDYNQFVRVSLDKYYTVTINGTVHKITATYLSSASLLDPELTATGYQLEDGQYLTLTGTMSNTEPVGTKYPLNLDYIVPTFVNEANWQTVTDDPAALLPGYEYGYYYYSEILPAFGQTSDVIESVKLDENVTNAYKTFESTAKVGFNVDVYAEAIQATQEVLEMTWNLEQINPPTLLTP